MNFNLMKIMNVERRNKSKEDCERDGKCLIIFSNSCANLKSGSNFSLDEENDLEMPSTKQRNQANARERFRTHRLIQLD